MDEDVAKVFNAYPNEIKQRLILIRSLIFQQAEALNVGKLTETLKWGEPAYLTKETKSGTTIRLAWRKAQPDAYGVFLNCNTSLVETYRSLFKSELEFVGNREIRFSLTKEPDLAALSVCIGMALTYHRDKSKKT